MTRTQRGSLRKAFLLIALISLLLVPFHASAAPKGGNINPDAEPLIPMVATDSEMAFSVRFKNPGPSTLNHLTFVGTAKGAEYVASNDARCGAVADDPEKVSCNFGQLAANDELYLEFYYTAAAAGDVDFTGRFQAEARRSQPGTRFDTWDTDKATVAVNGDPKFHAAWERNGTPANARFSVGGTDGIQSSSVRVPNAVANAYASKVHQLGANVSCSNINVSTQFGEAVDVQINQGQSAVQVTVMYLRSSLPSTLSPTNVRIVHRPDGSTICHAPPRCDGTNAGNCFDAWWDGNGNSRKLVLYVEQPTNGRFKGF